MLTPIASAPAAELPKDASRAGLQKACSEFESIFINYMLKSMRATVAKDGLLGDSKQRQIIQSMHDESLARGIAGGGGIGLADILFQHLNRIV
jgi:flagellar protein FlgJ